MTASGVATAVRVADGHTIEDLRQKLSADRPVTTAELVDHFAPTFAQIEADYPRRNVVGELGHDAVELLRQSGYTRLRLPYALGGIGATWPQVAHLLALLAKADPNLPQALHGHFLFTEPLLTTEQPIRDWWLEQVAAGKIFANALVDPPKATGAAPTLLETPDADTVQAATVSGTSEVARLNGTKLYSTGSLLADYVVIQATRAEDYAKDPASADLPQHFVVIDADAPGLELVDDWDGIGQKLTASGTTYLRNVPVKANRTYYHLRPGGVVGYSLVWITLAAVQVGIGLKALDDAATYAASRKRSYGHASTALPKDDPQVHEVVGRIAADARSALRILTSVASELEEAYEQVAGLTDLQDENFLRTYGVTNVAVAEASLTISDLILKAANELFEVGGASQTVASKHFHDHWLNARTVASHTPLIYRARFVGDYHINGTIPALNLSAKDPSKAVADQQTTESSNS